MEQINPLVQMKRYVEITQKIIAEQDSRCVQLKANRMSTVERAWGTRKCAGSTGR